MAVLACIGGLDWWLGFELEPALEPTWDPLTCQPIGKVRTTFGDVWGNEQATTALPCAKLMTGLPPCPLLIY